MFNVGFASTVIAITLLYTAEFDDVLAARL
jgi:hypothetical protein